MLEATHRRIAGALAKFFNLNERWSNLLEIGSVEPDRSQNFPHHKDKEGEIVENILKARTLYVQGDDECCLYLGIALHYIQDRWTLSPRLKDKHTEWEVSVNNVLNESTLLYHLLNITRGLLIDSKMETEIKKALLPKKVEDAYLSILAGLGWPPHCGFTSISDDALKQKWTGYFFQWDGNIPCFYYPSGRRIRRVTLYSTSLDSREVIYLRPFGAKVVWYALQERPGPYSTPAIDLNFAGRICLGVTSGVFSNTPDISRKDFSIQRKTLWV